LFSNSERYGFNNIGNGKKINIEFVSTNPTGPIHVAHIRGAIIGDVLASILERSGFIVTREYYVNDAGSQINILGKSLYKRYQQLCGINVFFSNEEYPGEYLINIAKLIYNKDGNKWLNTNKENDKIKYFENFAVKSLILDIKEDLSLINITFDKFTFESEIVFNKFIDKVFTLLKEKGLLYEGFLDKPMSADDDKWEPRKQLLFRSSKFGDDADRPFQKADGEWTYFANDAAYHYEKHSRGYDQLINIWGADHVGYVSRMKSIVEVISNKKNYLDVEICQIVRLIKNGKLLKMSKREGNFITLKEIEKEVGKDALRYFMVSTKSETPIDFDMNKVIEKNKDNPVFYCQYAFARASSVINKAKLSKIIPDIHESIEQLSSNYVSKYEWDIILKILAWPYLLKQAVIFKQPHRITNYLEDLCSHFHSFWNKGKDDQSLRFIDENNVNKTKTKLIWLESLRITLRHAFNIIGIDAPENM
ncbi:arginine--tRNA ligase, partial [Alphaproteobacteria bacterium]|nr:arginine--tRNA ligase [Alphaproteobacteria bacterium]